MSIRIIKLVDLKEGEKYKPEGALGRHYINVIKKKLDTVIIQEYKTFEYYEIKDGSLYKAGRILNGLEEQAERISMHKRWAEKQIQSIQLQIDAIDREYNDRVLEDKFFGFPSELKLRKQLELFEEQIQSIKEMAMPVFKSKSVLIKDIEESYQQ